MIVDSEEEGTQSTERLQRAILIHAQASKLQGEILEQNNQHQQAHEIFVKAKALLSGAFQLSETPASQKLLQELGRSIYRTRLTIKYVQSNSPTFEILNQQPKNKKDAILKQNLTNAYITKQNRRVLEPSNSGVLPVAKKVERRGADTFSMSSKKLPNATISRQGDSPEHLQAFNQTDERNMELASEPYRVRR